VDNTPKTTVQDTTGLSGLTTAEVAERIADGRVNDVPDAPVRTTSEIFRANVLTPINAIMGALFALILVAGFPGDALFAGVIVSNSIIGTVQELRARRTLTDLAVLSAPGARVVRDGTATDIDVSGVVADDLLELRPGDQVVVDGVVVDALGLEVDESLLTGEADPVDKAVGDMVLSGSFVAAGTGHVRATGIGSESYAVTLAEEARRFSLVDSDDAVNRMRQGKPVEMVYPDQAEKDIGCFIVPNAAVLIKGAPHPTAAKKLIDYLLTKETERKLAFADCAQMPLHPGVKIPPELKPISELKVMQVDYAVVAKKMLEIQPLLKEWMGM